ncbi:MAG: methyltransferase domain-containing protein [Verrucomicrobiae bacterium]
MADNYSDRFTSPQDVASYDAVEYGRDSYSSFIWKLQQPFLLRELAGVRSANQTLDLLDFACGTGRVLGFASPLATRSTGVDISTEMLEVAKLRCPDSRLLAGDIRTTPSLLDSCFDAITMFRFILNAGPEISRGVLMTLRKHINPHHGILIANVHGNSWSTRRLAIAHHKRKLAKNPEAEKPFPMLEEMSPPQMKRLLESAGFELVRSYGFGLFPNVCYRLPCAAMIKCFDRIFAGNTPAKWLSTDLLLVARPR